MLDAYATGLAVMVLLAVAWAGVQSAWREVFPAASADVDVLAGRPGCGGCGDARARNACEEDER
jgi:hypothetical protein